MNQKEIQTHFSKTVELLGLTIGAGIAAGVILSAVSFLNRQVSMLNPVCRDPEIFAWTTPEKNQFIPRSDIVALKLKNDVNVEELNVDSEKYGHVDLMRSLGYPPRSLIALLPLMNHETGEQMSSTQSISPPYIDPVSGINWSSIETQAQVATHKSYYPWPSEDTLKVKYTFKHDHCPNSVKGEFTFKTGSAL